MKVFLKALIIALMACSGISALETQKGQIKVLLEEDKGTFSVFHVDGGPGGEERSFFVNQDPRTSGVFLLIDNKIYRMGQNSSFKQQALLTEEGAAYVWTSPAFKVTMDFIFISSTGGTYSDGIQMRLTVENLTSRTQNVAVRFLFDTWLGESGKSHFLLAEDNSIEKETELDGDFPAYWISGNPDSDTRIQFMLTGRGTTTPSKVVFANWKRLNESNWFYETRTNRNFNYLPYSINDSAVAQYYDIQTLDGGKNRKISIFAGLFTEKGFAEISPTQAAMAAEPIVPVNTDNPGNLMEAIRVDLTQVNKVLKQIESLLSSEDDMDINLLKSLENSVAELEERRSRYLAE